MENIYSYLTHALSQDYIFLYYVNLETGHYTEYSTDHEELKIDGEGIDFFYACRENARDVIYPEDLDMFLSSFTRENILSTIQDNGTYKLTYRLMIKGKPAYVGLKATKAKGDDNHLIIGVTNVDVQIQLRDAQQRVAQEHAFTTRIAALFGDLICINVVDLQTEYFQEYSTYKTRLGLNREGENFFEQVIKKMHELAYPDDLPVIKNSFSRKQILAQIERYGVYELRYRLRLDGEPVHTQMKAVIVEENEKKVLLIGLMNIDDIVRRENEYNMSLSEARNQAQRDALTGVKNRHAYLGDVDELNGRIASGKMVEFAIAICDINNLKQVNDIYGHQMGDEYIRKGCRVICDIFSHSPVYRVGGDEFAAIIQGRDYGQIDVMMQQLEAVNQRHRASGDVVVACGMAVYCQDQKVEDVFARADQNMYEEKKRLKKSSTRKELFE